MSLGYFVAYSILSWTTILFNLASINWMRTVTTSICSIDQILDNLWQLCLIPMPHQQTKSVHPYVIIH